MFYQRLYYRDRYIIYQLDETQSEIFFPIDTTADGGWYTGT